MANYGELWRIMAKVFMANRAQHNCAIRHFAIIRHWYPPSWARHPSTLTILTSPSLPYYPYLKEVPFLVYCPLPFLEACHRLQPTNVRPYCMVLVLNKLFVLQYNLITLGMHNSQPTLSSRLVIPHNYYK